MTSLSLTLWIVLAVALQLAVWLGYSFWQHWLAHQALHRQALGLQLPEAVPAPDQTAPPPAWPGLRPFRVQRKVMEDEANSVCSFYLVAEDGQALPPFLPGQYLTFHLDAGAEAAAPLIRCYSLSDSPRPDHYRVSIKRVPGADGHPPGRSSCFFHDHVQPGSLLQVRAPSGHFFLDRRDEPVVLIGGGIGITPMLSMLEWCLTEQPGREVWLFYGVRNGREMVMASRLAELAAAHPGLRLWRCFSDPRPEDVAGRDYEHRGRVDIPLLRLHLSLKPHQFYLCGPGAMMECLVAGLADWGVADERVHFEAFGPASVRRPAVQAVAGEAVVVRVNFARSGKQLLWQPGAGSLLEFAEANGIGVDSGCRAGGCGACQTVIADGEVSYEQKPDYDPEPGSCLLCVCTPKTDLILEA
ncbi:MAG: 2Fe-2S iron-sulfur cluster-binding protein [Fluviicoccus sp.]|uniref:2Fe-2S iron-sulfur cluster-binding protein n=1 Tax=Fluviicoccus sp. TaxID=2003552 RepID=UPI00271592B4|nr:2Fe-2S iron-sulfur cluster-binding protein [Fluviicoccus sp.]MDO8331970.1 2Fe-2S iron-sulfur cluster-binding protein [Fluviicoccus sp.]